MVIAVVLGNRMLNDGSMSPLMQKRLSLCVALMKERQIDYVVLSGGTANKKAKISEARAMYDYLKDKTDENKLIVEEQSKDTRQNARFSVSLAKKLCCDEIIVCTTKEHMHRWWLNPLKLFQKEIGKDGSIKLNGYCD